MGHPGGVIPLSVDDVGPIALARMFRDGVVAHLAPGYGMPRDLPVSAETRARTLSPVVPAHTVVSGLAGLWVRHGGPAPSVVDLVGARGLHRAKPGADAKGWTLAFHSGRAASGPCDVYARVAVASSERCAADALRWDDLAVTMPAVLHAVRAGRLDPAVMSELVGSDDPRGFGARRAHSAWAAAATTLKAPMTRSDEAPRLTTLATPARRCGAYPE